MSDNIKRKLIIANWKMNPSTLKEAKKIFNNFKKQKTSTKGVTTVFCPPLPYVLELQKNYRGNKIFFGAQDVSFEKEGAFTGEISTSMLKDLGAHFVIVGHSERRALGETSEIVSKKVCACLSGGLHTILCVGEKERDFEGNYLKELSRQITESLSNLAKEQTKKLIIAYEPIWAVGEGKKAMDAKDMHFISLFIKKQLIKMFNKKVAKDVAILYGGSVDSENSGEFISECDINGLLVGRASLNPYEFSKIVSNVSNNIHSRL